jgi:hypothetical protein
MSDKKNWICPGCDKTYSIDITTCECGVRFVDWSDVRFVDWFERRPGEKTVDSLLSIDLNIVGSLLIL